MMQTLSSRICLASGLAGVLLLGAIPRGSAQVGTERTGLGDIFNEGKGKKHLRFEASIGTRDPFSGANQAGSPESLTFRRGEIYQVVVRGTPLDGYHTYPLTRRAPEQSEQVLCTIEAQGGPSFVLLYPVKESASQWVKPLNLEWQLEHDKPFTWTFDLLVQPKAVVASSEKLTLKIRAYVCNEGTCTWEDHVVAVSMPISSEEPLSPSGDVERQRKPIAATIVPVPDGNSTIPTATEVDDVSGTGGGSSGLLQAILIAISGGFVSLLTPCVFPMIPITVSYFLKQSEAKHSSAVLMALVYSGTIVLILAAGGLFLLQVLTQISTHYATNFALGAIFLFFGLSLLGWYDVTLPTWLQDATAAREGKGGLFGVFFMALTFSIVSFSCVGPIYGGFISLKAGGSSGQFQLVLSVVAFAVAFASPFFLLALFPKLLKSMPRAGSWMNSVKVVMGFLELAAVVKFIRAGELSLTGAADYFSYDLSLGIYVALSVASGLYLLGLFRLPHDHDTPESIGVPRLMFSLGFLSLALYLMPGLFKTSTGQTMQPRGLVFGWVDSFLLPDPESDGDLVWNTKLPAAIEQAKKENKLIFIDFTGTLCTNCKLNERNAFPRPEIKAVLRKHVLLKLYTDTIPAGTEQFPAVKDSLLLRNTRFKSASLPLYAVLQPIGDDYRIVRIYDGGLIQSPGQRKAFVDFLSKK